MDGDFQNPVNWNLKSWECSECNSVQRNDQAKNHFQLLKHLKKPAKYYKCIIFCELGETINEWQEPSPFDALPVMRMVFNGRCDAQDCNCFPVGNKVKITPSYI